MTIRVFIGLVTHPGSLYPEAAGPQGLAAQLGASIEASDHAEFNVVLEICAENLLEFSSLPTDSREVRTSINAELSVESDWRIYLDPEVPRIRLSLLMRARTLYRYLKLSPPWKKEVDAEDAGPRMLTRLANIELAHISLLKAAAESQADWVLILEDDAWVESPSELSKNLIEFLVQGILPAPGVPNRQPAYVNLSESFSTRKLGIEGESSEIGSWGAGSKIFAASKPVTNTVCAILYSRNFVGNLLREFESIPIQPVIPIDWKLNKAIMNMYSKGILGVGDCWLVEPAPIVQGSMHAMNHSRVEK
jgi:hypothetical protein